ncbi:MAG: hypothetical protein ACOCPM_02115 [Bacteroidales bacterium]
MKIKRNNKTNRWSPTQTTHNFTPTVLNILPAHLTVTTLKHPIKLKNPGLA